MRSTSTQEGSPTAQEGQPWAREASPWAHEGSPWAQEGSPSAGGSGEWRGRGAGVPAAVRREDERPGGG
eukprot:gene4082-biopygen1381